MKKSIADLINSHVPLGKLSATGYYKFKCPICNDYKERGGIKLENGSVGVNCFNCGFGAVYDESSERLSKKFRQFLTAFGISSDEIDECVSKKFFELKSESKIITLEQVTKVSLFTPEISLPPLSVRITPDNFPRENEYLQSRGLDVNSYPFYVSVSKKLIDRIIIPFYKYDKLIYWQARTIVDAKLRYLNCDASKEAVMFQIDRLSTNQQSNLFITEGSIDALLVNGVALIGSKLNAAKIELLRRSRRRLIFVIDSDKNGYHLGEQVIKEGLGTITSTGSELDINGSIIRYGKLWTFYQLNKRIANTPTEQQLLLNNLKAGI